MDKILRKIILNLSKLYFKSLKKKERTYLNASAKVVDEEDLCNLIDASLDMWFTLGRFNEKFEKEFATYLNIKNVITTNSGSSANLLALSALTSPKLAHKALKKGDEIITVATGFPTTINAIVQNGLIPVFVDTDIPTYNIIVEDIKKAITPKTKAIMIAHSLGNMFDIKSVKEICEKNNLWLIEDSCDALGSEFMGKKAGTIGDIGTFSFYPAHHITMGEGGALATNNPQLAKIIRSFRDWGRDCSCPGGQDGICKKRFSQQLGKLPFGYDHKYSYSHFGYNLKITDMQASLGLSQLKKLPDFLKKREENATYLLNKLSDLKEYLILPEITKDTKSSWFGFLISTKENSKIQKQELVKFLEENNVGTRQLFSGNILRQPLFTTTHTPIKINNSEILFSDELDEKDYKKLPNTEFILNHTFWIGCHPDLNKKHLDKISDLIHKFIKELN